MYVCMLCLACLLPSIFVMYEWVGRSNRNFDFDSFLAGWLAGWLGLVGLLAGTARSARCVGWVGSRTELGWYVSKL